MDNYRIALKIPINRDNFDISVFDIRANNLQEAIDLSFARFIVDGKKRIEDLSNKGLEPVIKRSEVKIDPLLKYNNGFQQDLQFVNGFKHPSRLEDTDFRRLLQYDFCINGNRFFKSKEELGSMIFYI